MPSNAASTEKPLILIVDDEPSNIAVAGESLKDLCYLRVARSGEEALLALQTGNIPDLILLDVVMPGMNGYEFCKKLKNDLRYKNIPIVFITAKDTIDDEILGLEVGASDYINKPFNSTLLQHRVSVQLDIKKYRDNLEEVVTERTSELVVANDKLQHVIGVQRRVEEELRKSEERFRGVVDNIGVGVAVISPDMSIISTNKQLKKQFPDVDFSQGPITCHRAFNDPPLDNICPHCPAVKTLEDKDVHEVVVNTIQGKSYRIISSPLTDGTGKVVAVVKIIGDISRQKMAEQKLKESKARLAAQKKGLEQKNIAMREIMAQLEGEKVRIEENISKNIEKLILPSLDKIQTKVNSPHLDIVRRNLFELTSSFGAQLNRSNLELTPKEIGICDMIRKGFTNKELAEHLGISVKTVEAHRKKIRKKLNLTNQKINLQTYLQQM